MLLILLKKQKMYDIITLSVKVCFSEVIMELELKEIYKNFGAKEVLKGISFCAESGKAFGLLGRNGAGKTTTIRILMGVFPADKGKITLNGMPIDYDRVRLGYLPEERGLYPKKKIIDQLVYLAELKGMNRSDAIKSVDYWLGRLGMSEYRDKKLETLSKGNQQKIQLVTTLAHDPQIIVLDEPFSGLDPVNAELLKDVVKEEMSNGKIILFSSHQMNYIEEFCDRIAILKDGKAVLYGELDDIKKHLSENRISVKSDQVQLIASELTLEHELSDRGELIIKLESPDDRQRVMAMITEKYSVSEIKVFTPTLGEIFVRYASDGQNGGK